MLTAHTDARSLERAFGRLPFSRTSAAHQEPSHTAVHVTHPVFASHPLTFRTHDRFSLLRCHPALAHAMRDHHHPTRTGPLMRPSAGRIARDASEEKRVRAGRRAHASRILRCIAIAVESKSFLYLAAAARRPACRGPYERAQLALFLYTRVK